MENCKMIAITNQKGDVGKTTTTVNLGVGLTKQGKRVMLLDADPQGSLTVSLGMKDPDDLPVSLANIMQAVIDKVTISADHTEAVDVMSAIGVFDGTDGVFNPTGNLKRSEAAKIIMYIVMGKTNADVFSTTDRPFTDVTDSHWAVNSIAWCYEMGIVSGTTATTYSPEDYLTGTAFAKMLLVALGYDSKIEGYQDNPMWSTNINSDALTAGLRVKLEAVDMGKPITREQACQMAFNALTADMVTYTDRGFEYNGLIVGASPATAIVRNEFNGSAVNYAGDVQGTVGLDVQQLCEFYYPLLRQVETTDGMGREAYLWSWKSADIGTYSVPADFTYYVSSTVKSVIANNRGALVASSMDTADVYVNGGTDLTYLDMRGNKVELYMSDEQVNVIEKVVVTHNNVERAWGAADVYGNYVDIPATSVTGKFVWNVEGYEAVQTGDVIMWHEDINGVIHVSVAESFSAVMTASTASTGSNAVGGPETFTIGGNTYRPSGQTGSQSAGTLVGRKGDTSATFWVDEANNLIWSAGASTPVNVLQVLKNNSFNSGNVFAGNTVQSQVVFGETGETAVINISRVDSYTGSTLVPGEAPKELDDLNGDSGDRGTTNNDTTIQFGDNEGAAQTTLYRYVYNQASNTYALYTLTNVSSTGIGGDTITTGIPSAFSSAYSDTVITNDNTVFLLRNPDPTGTDPEDWLDSYTTYVGYKNVPSLTVGTNGGVYYAVGGIARYVFINDYTLSSSPVSDHIYVLGEDVTSHWDAATQSYYLSVEAIVNGSKTQAKIVYGAQVADKDGVVNDLDLQSEVIQDHTLYVITSYDPATGYISAMAEAVSSAGPVGGSNGTHYWVDLEGSRAPANGIVVLDTADRSITDTSFAFANDCVVYTISASGDVVSTGGIEKLITDTNDLISVVVAGDAYGTAANSTLKEVYVYKQNPTGPAAPTPPAAIATDVDAFLDDTNGKVVFFGRNVDITTATTPQKTLAIQEAFAAIWNIADPSTVTVDRGTSDGSTVVWTLSAPGTTKMNYTETFSDNAQAITTGNASAITGATSNAAQLAAAQAMVKVSTLNFTVTYTSATTAVITGEVATEFDKDATDLPAGYGNASSYITGADDRLGFITFIVPDDAISGDANSDPDAHTILITNLKHADGDTVNVRSRSPYHMGDKITIDGITYTLNLTWSRSATTAAPNTCP